jgi:hypothetical protein
MLLALAIVGGAVKAEDITIVRTRVVPLLPLPTPNWGDHPFTPRDVVLIRDVTPEVESRELIFVSGNGFAVLVNPVTGTAWFGSWPNSWPNAVRRRARIDEHSIVFVMESGTMRVDRDANTFSLWTPKTSQRAAALASSCRDHVAEVKFVHPVEPRAFP